jgi:hypothetical protein
MQLYLRYADGEQKIVEFDKVAVADNQFWGFNYVTDDINESAVPIEPSFYSWLNWTLTESQIVQQVQELIEATS